MRLCPFHFANTRLLRQMIVWALVVALPINSISTVLTSILGASHRHAGTEAFDTGTSSSWSARELLRAVVGNETLALIDGAHLRERGLRMPAHLAVEADMHPHEHQHGPADHGHTHLHGMFERHFHDPSDESVVVMGVKESGQSAPGHTHGVDEGCVVLLPLAVMIPALMLAQGCSAWQQAKRVAWRSHVDAPLERPPRD
ncbi:MAG: hypothetical protein Q7U28_16790 [Aquabacterium sp.]|nr:hypothetical protein [Aquabacterium sp.]